MSKKQKDQQEAIWELLTTEATYISKLHVIKKVSISLVVKGSVLNLPLPILNVFRKETAMSLLGGLHSVWLLISEFVCFVYSSLCSA